MRCPGQSLFLIVFLHTKPLLETVHAAAGIDELLFSGEERMAFRADFHADIALGGRGLDHFAAGAGDSRLLILGMNILFHSCHLFQKPGRSGGRGLSGRNPGN